MSGVQVGSLIVSRVSSPFATWSSLILLLSIHLAMNHAAVRAVSLNTLNRQRANIVLSGYLAHGTALTPTEVSGQERIFERDGVLRWEGSAPMGKAKVGVRLHELLTSMAPADRVTGSTRDSESLLLRLVGLYDQDDYLLWYGRLDQTIYIVLKNKVRPTSQLKAWAQGLLVARSVDAEVTTDATTNEKILALVKSTLIDVTRRWSSCVEHLTAAGWNLDVAHLETTSGTRVCLRDKL